MSFLEHIQEAYSALHGMLYAQVVEPVLFAMGKMAWAEDAFDGTEWFLLGHPAIDHFHDLSNLGKVLAS